MQLAGRELEVDFPSDELGGGTAEHLLGGGIDEQEAPARLGHDDRVGQLSDQVPELIVRAVPGRSVGLHGFTLTHSGRDRYGPTANRPAISGYTE